jgi:hypothetical protein
VYIFRLTCIDEEINEINELIEKNNIMEDRIPDKNTKKIMMIIQLILMLILIL